MEQAPMIIPARDRNAVARDWLTVTPHFTDRQIDGLMTYFGCNEETVVAMVKAREKSVEMCDMLATFKADYPGAMGVLVLPDVVQSGKRKGCPMQTYRNFLHVFTHDEKFFGCKYNQLRNVCEIHTVKDGLLQIDDRSSYWDAQTKMYLEQEYSLRSKETFEDAATVLFHDNSYNPVVDILNSLVWDGKGRREQFLIKYAGADDTPYNREVSRLIFDGIVARTFNPGCKFDIMPVLVGRQGCGKSTLIRWLAINDAYYGEVDKFDGAESIEQLFGKTVLEVCELKAIKNARDIETVKAYITRLADRYRIPYERSPMDYPRRCILIGSTNNSEFLNDKTGGRRFFPVNVHCNGEYIYSHEQEIRTFIEQCLAESVALYSDVATRPALIMPPALTQIAEQIQEQAQESDYRVGKIEYHIAYDRKIGDLVCARWCWEFALEMPAAQTFPKREQQEINQILQSFPFLKKLDKQKRIGAWGKQNAYEVISKPQGYENE